MKRFLGIFTALTCIFTLAAGAFAEEPFEVSEVDEYAIGAVDEVADAEKTTVSVNSSPSFAGDADAESGNTPSFVGDADSESTQPAGDEPQDSGHGALGTGNIDDIYKYWEENGYPDDVSYAFEAGGEMLDDTHSVSWWEIGVVNATDARKQEILGLVSNKCMVQFIDCKYSYATRNEIYNEIRSLNDSKISDVVMNRNGQFVFVHPIASITDDELKALGRELNGKYGNVIQFVVDDASDAGIQMDAGMGIGETTLLTGVEDKNDYTLWLVTAAVVVLVAAVAVTAAIRVKSRARVTADGTVVAGKEKASAAEVKQAVAKNQAEPDDKVFDEIMKKLD